MRTVLLFSLILTAVTGCCSTCPTQVNLTTPEATIASFHQAFACDDKALEYQCLSDHLKEAFGHILGYSVGRDVFRAENQMLVLLLDYAALDDRLTVEYDPDGNHATVQIETGSGQRLTIELINEPEYRLFLSDGTEIHEFASSVQAVQRGEGIFVMIRDPHLAEFTGRRSTAIQRVETKPRWVIASLPGQDDALKNAAQPTP